MQAANSARTPYHPHTTLADRQATSSPVPPDSVPPLPRSRQYLWGSRPAASSGAGVPLPALQRRLPAPGYPLQYSCLENPMYKGAWRARVHGVAKSQT